MQHSESTHSTLISVMTQFQSKVFGFHRSCEWGRLLNLPPTPSGAGAKICPHLAIHPAILSVHTSPPAPPLPASSSFPHLLVPRVGLGGDNSLSAQEQLRARLRALWSEEQLLFAVSGSITVWNDNMGGSRAPWAPLLILYRNHNSCSAYSAYITHVCKTTINR